MLTNPVIDAMLRRKSIREYTEQSPSDETIEAVVRAGQQAPFAAQLYSVLLSRRRDKHPFKAPLLFTICIDFHKLEKIMSRRNWQMVTNNLTMLLFGIQDATLVAQNMVMAAESVGLGSCFLGMFPKMIEKIVNEYKLPPRVFPLVRLAMGYPAEDPPPRPRYPLDYVLFEDRYGDLDDAVIEKAMAAMDDGYLDQDYYSDANYMIPLENDRRETYSFANYSWTEHISRKWGQWDASPDEMLKQFEKCGIAIPAGGQQK